MLQSSSVSTRIKGPHMQMQRTRARIRFLIYNYRFLINRIRLWIADKIRGLFGSFALFFTTYILYRKGMFTYMYAYLHTYTTTNTHMHKRIYTYSSLHLHLYIYLSVFYLLHWRGRYMLSLNFPLTHMQIWTYEYA